MTRIRYEEDEASTPRYTTLNLKIDAGAAGPTGVHWHVADGVEVRYASVDDEREQMLWVEAKRRDGSWHRYANVRAPAGASESGHVRVMDCVDCHNRATHIYEDPGRAVDEAIRLGRIDRSLPFIRREAVAAIRAGYPTREAGFAGIRAAMDGFYRREYPDRASAWLDRIDAAVAVLQEIYARNIHHEMNISWGAYPSLLGHGQSPGCFRCHSRDLQDAEGAWISDGCTVCHSILANDEREPFAYLGPAGENDSNRAMHLYLREEFLSSYFN